MCVQWYGMGMALTTDTDLGGRRITQKAKLEQPNEVLDGVKKTFAEHLPLYVYHA